MNLEANWTELNWTDHCDIVKHDTFVGVQAAIPTAAIPTKLMLLERRN